MLEILQPVKERIELAGTATRADIFEALSLISETEEDRDTEITELVSGIYDTVQTNKLLADLDSYQV